MRKLYISFLHLFLSATIAYSQMIPCEDGMAGPYPCKNIDFLAYMPLSEIGGGANTNDLWGWFSPVTGKEYALVGCNNGTAFVDVSDPVNPVYLGLLPPHSGNSLWRDLETYQNYCFIGSEAAGHGLQVFDLLQLDNVTNPPVTFTESAHYGGFGNSHVVTIDRMNGFLYACGTNTYSGGLHIVNIQDPLHPTLAGGFALEGYTHDCFIWNYDGPDEEHTGKQIVFACNGTKLAIVDCTDKTDCESLGAYTYPGLGYVHQGWVTKDKKHFILNDELDETNFLSAGNPIGTRTHLFQIEDMDDLEYMGFVETDNSAIDHNLYIIDHFVYESNYSSGLRIIDAVKVADGELNEVAYFDLYPQNDVTEYVGTWSNYAFLPSGINIATSIYEGLFIMKPRLIVPSESYWDVCSQEDISFELTINAELAFPLTTAISGLGDATVNDLLITETGTYNITLSNLSALNLGSYSPKLLLVTDFGEEYEIELKVIISSEAPDAPELLTNFLIEPPNTVLTWPQVDNASQYHIQISTDENFENILVDELVTGNIFASFNGLDDGQYYWHISAINDCGEGVWSNLSFFTLAWYVNRVDEMIPVSVSVYPNPAETEVRVIANRTVNYWSITDLSGRTVKDASLMQNEFLIDVSDLAQGVYLLRVGDAVTRFIKQ